MTPLQLSTVFKAAFEKSFGRLDSVQIDSLAQIVLAFKSYGDGDAQKLAYILATAYHESRLKPISEIRAKAGTELRKRQDRYWNTGYYGRGFVQLTWRENYVRMGRFLGVDLKSNPDLALNPFYAANILVYGMMNGSFTGQKLSDFIDNGVANFHDARRVVNVLDRATLIEGYAVKLMQNVEL